MVVVVVVVRMMLMVRLIGDELAAVSACRDDHSAWC